MGLFGNPRKNKNAWAAIVMENAQPGAKIDEKMLDLATELYIKQRIRILYESIRLVFSSENEKQEGTGMSWQGNTIALC